MWRKFDPHIRDPDRLSVCESTVTVPFRAAPLSSWSETVHMRATKKNVWFLDTGWHRRFVGQHMPHHLPFCGCTLPRQCWHQHARVLLKGLDWSLGSLTWRLDHELTSTHINYPSTNFHGFPTPKNSSNRIRHASTSLELVSECHGRSWMFLFLNFINDLYSLRWAFK